MLFPIEIPCPWEKPFIENTWQKIQSYKWK